VLEIAGGVLVGIARGLRDTVETDPLLGDELGHVAVLSSWVVRSPVLGVRLAYDRP
jgi:hypothetical protein